MATRLKLPASGSPAVLPSFQSYSHSAATTRRTLPTSDASALGSVAQTPDGADHLVAGDTFHSQFVSEPLAAGIAFVTSDTVKYAIQCLEANANNNLFIQLYIRVVSLDGTTEQAVLLTKSLDGTELPTALNCRTASHNLTSNYTTALGDRIVVEFSVSGTPTATSGTQGHNATLRWGANGAGGDLAENESQTGTTLNPWVEFSRTLTFAKVAVIGQASETGTAQIMTPLMTLWFTQSGHNRSAGSAAFHEISTSSNVAVGERVAVAVALYDGLSPTAAMMSNSGSATLGAWTRVDPSLQSAGDIREAIMTAVVTGAGSLTIRVTPGVDKQFALAYWVIKASAGTIVALTGASGTGNNSSPAITGNIVTSVKAVIVGLVSHNDATTAITEGSNYTSDGENEDASFIPYAIEHRTTVPIAAGTYTMDWTIAASASRTWGCAAAAFGLSGTTVAINQNSETDTAQALTARKTKAIAQATETDTAQPVSEPGPIVVAIGQANETDSAQAFTRRKTRTVAQGLESDTAQPFAARKTKAFAQSSETNTAQAFARLKNKAIAQSLETTTSQAFTHAKRKAIAQNLETDTAQPMSGGGAHVVAIGQALETDTAQPFAVAPKFRLLHTATETSTAQPFTHKKTRAIVQSLETATALGFTHRKTKTIGQPSETAIAQVMAKAKRRGLAQVEESNVAQAMRWAPKIRIIGRAEELSSAFAMTAIQGEVGVAGPRPYGLAFVSVVGGLNVLSTPGGLGVLSAPGELSFVDE